MSSVMRFDEWQDSNGVPIFNGAGGVSPSGFTASETITATNASWPVPALSSPIVKVTVIGGGGGGAGTGGSVADIGGNGGTTTFNAGGAGTITAAGGEATPDNTAGTPPAGLRSGNGGPNANVGGTRPSLAPGAGGVITVAYLDLTGISTVNVTIGAGGTAGSGNATPGGRGEVIVEYVAG